VVAVPPVPPVPAVPFPVPAPPVAGPLGVVVAGAAGVAADALEPPLDADDADDDPVELLVVAVVSVVLVCVVLVFEAGCLAVEVGTVNGGTSDVSADVELLPQATRPTDSAAPLKRATANFRMVVGRTVKRGGDPFACRKQGSR
jgi:hypothetical protein